MSVTHTDLTVRCGHPSKAGVPWLCSHLVGTGACPDHECDGFEEANS